MILAIDIGGTKIAAALVSDGRVIDHRSANSIMHSNYAGLPDAVAALCEDWDKQYQAIGIASAGLVESDRVCYVSVKGRPSLDLAAAIEARLGLRPVILNDAGAGALGEYVHGDFGGVDTVVYVTISTGIGAGIIHKGKLLTSRNGLMAHLGHMHVARDGHPPITCNCGRFNCIESFASGTAIARQGSELLGRPVSAQDILEMESKDPALAQLINQATQSLTEIFADTRALCGADTFVIGGSVGLNPIFFQRLKSKVEGLAAPWAAGVQQAALGRNAELLGAAHAAQNHIRTS